MSNDALSEDLFKQASIFLPKYLTPAQKNELFSELQSFPDISGFYLPPGVVDANVLLQGDGWRGFLVIDFFSLQKKRISGVIISNSCDIDVRNQKTLSPRILFS